MEGTGPVPPGRCHGNNLLGCVGRKSSLAGKELAQCGHGKSFHVFGWGWLGRQGQVQLALSIPGGFAFCECQSPDAQASDTKWLSPDNPLHPQMQPLQYGIPFLHHCYPGERVPICGVGKGKHVLGHASRRKFPH